MGDKYEGVEVGIIVKVKIRGLGNPDFCSTDCTYSDNGKYCQLFGEDTPDELRCDTCRNSNLY